MSTQHVRAEKPWGQRSLGAVLASGLIALSLSGIPHDSALATTACTTTSTTLSDTNSDGVYEITSADDLIFLSDNYDQAVPGDSDIEWRQKRFVLTESIDLGGCLFEPIGRNNDPFTGVFNGGGLTISNLNVTKTGWYSGLFARLENSSVSSLTLANVTVSATPSEGAAYARYGGALAGAMNNTEVSDITLTNVSIDVTDDWVGGLVGRGLEGSRTTGISALDVTVSGGVYVGGLIGEQTDDRGSITQVTATEVSVSGENHVGGIVGQEAGEDSNLSEISVSSITVDGTSTVGGIVGEETGTDSLISDITVSALDVDGSQTTGVGTGGIVGYVWGGVTIRRVTAENISVDGNQNVGGLAGQLEESTGVELQFDNLAVSGGTHVGGFTGVLMKSRVIRAKVQGTVSASSREVGGFVGLITGADSDTAIEFSSANVTVTAPRSEEVGGFIGDFNSPAPTIRDSYSRGAVTGGTGVGGFIGEGEPDGPTVESSYSTGAVSGTTAFGFIADSDVTATNSFWDTQTSGQASSNGGSGKTTSQMTSFATFSDAGWDIVRGWEAFDSNNDKVWGICSGVNDGYPFLLWEYSSDPCPEPEPAVTTAPSSEGPQRADAPALHFDAPTPVGSDSGSTELLAEGEGLDAGQSFVVSLNPGGQVLASGQASGAGFFSTTTALPQDLPAGTYTLTLRSTDPLGNPLVLTQRFAIDQAGRFIPPQSDAPRISGDPAAEDSPTSSGEVPADDTTPASTAAPSSEPPAEALENSAARGSGEISDPARVVPANSPPQLIPSWLVAAALSTLGLIILGGISLGIYRARNPKTW